MHESRNKMQPEISLGTAGSQRSELLLPMARSFLVTRWLVRGDQRGWALLRFSQAGMCYILLTRPR